MKLLIKGEPLSGARSSLAAAVRAAEMCPPDCRPSLHYSAHSKALFKKSTLWLCCGLQAATNCASIIANLFNRNGHGARDRLLRMP